MQALRAARRMDPGFRRGDGFHSRASGGGERRVAAVVVIAAGIAACLGTRALIPLLRRASVLDRPNERSSHAIPTPRGGGIAVVAASLAAWLVLVAAGAAPLSLLAVIAGAAMLAVISWLDDLRGLSPAVRFGAQCAAVALGVLRAAGRSGVSGMAACRARQGRGGAALGLVRQSLQFHGRHRRDRRQRDGGDRYRAGAVRDCRHRKRSRARRRRRR